jgi:hypothetical protein
MTKKRFDLYVSIIALLDILERIDTFILEIRNVQETILSELRSGELYKLLDYSESFLWGTYSNKEKHVRNWSFLFQPDVIRDIGRDASLLADGWCPAFPSATLRENYINLNDAFVEQFSKYLPDSAWDKEHFSSTLRGAYQAYDALYLTESLSANEVRLYEALQQLQFIKRDALRDKIVTAYRGYWSLISGKEPVGVSESTAFMLVRRAALMSLRDHLERFDNIVEMVQEIFNLSLERDPPPTARRRRDQGIYSTDIADSCGFRLTEIENFFTALTGEPECFGIDISPIIHRYTRSDTSTVYLKVSGSEGESDTFFIQSSYWMPERPDLQSLIAHEIAHAEIKYRYGDFTPFGLDPKQDAFARLMKDFGRTLEIYGRAFGNVTYAPNMQRALLTELGSDVVASITEGIPYLLAHFQDIAGQDYETLFNDGGKVNTNLSLNDVLENVTLLRQRMPDWYPRLRVAIAVVKAVHAQETFGNHRYSNQSWRHPRKLEGLLVDGIDTVTESLFSDVLKNMAGQEYDDFSRWRRMTNELVAQIERASWFIVPTRKWKEKREREASKDILSPGRTRHLRPVQPSVRRLCVRVWLDSLIEEPRLLGRVFLRDANSFAAINDSSINSAFQELYLGEMGGEDRNTLFRRLIDIPWQTAVFTSIDVLGSPWKNNEGTDESRGQVFRDIAWLGRDLYHTALEFTVWTERYPIDRLGAALQSLDAVVSVFRSVVSPGLQNFAQEAAQIATKYIGESSASFSEKTFTAINGITDTKDTAASEKWARRVIMEYKIPGKAIDNYHRKMAATSAVARDVSDLLAHVWMIEGHKNFHAWLCARRTTIESLFSDGDTSDHRRIRAALSLFIRTVAYMIVRPEVSRSDFDGSYLHHQLTSDTAGSLIDTFTKYFDVAISNRKRDRNRQPLQSLCPLRSIRIDRASTSSAVRRIEQAANWTRGLGSLGTYLTGAQPAWIPWSRDGSWPNDARPSFAAWNVALLGRFDRLTMSVARHTSRNQRPQRPDRRPYFVRQQIGIPFAAARAGGRLISHQQSGPLTPYQSHLLPNYEGLVPLATINLLLRQRSARLTFVDRLISDDLIFRRYGASTSYSAYEPSRDIGLLTDGWGDIFLVMMTDTRVVERHGCLSYDRWEDYSAILCSVKLRLDQIVRFRTDLFQDSLVGRTETSYMPLAADAALLHAHEYEVSFAFRLHTQRNGKPMMQFFEESVGEFLSKNKLGQYFHFSRVPGRMDYRLATTAIDETGAKRFSNCLREMVERSIPRRQPPKPMSSAPIFDAFFRLMFAQVSDENNALQFVDSISTTVAERQLLPFVK